MKTLRLLILGCLAVAATVGRAQITEPGWYQVQNPPADAGSPPASLGSLSPGSLPAFGFNGVFTPPAPQPATPVAEAITPEIQALADGLQHDPKRIFDYVHDHIKFVLYFGAKKGAALTLLEKSGNDFDQCALLVALLSAAGYGNTYAYAFDWMEVPYDDPYGNHYDLHHWWQLTLNNTNWATTFSYVRSLANSRGYPVNGTNSIIAPDTGQPIDGSYTNNILIQRIWVYLEAGTNFYYLDPAFKVSEPVAALPGFTLPNALGSGAISNDLLGAAAGTDNTNYTQNLSESAVRGKLTAYAGNLLNYLPVNAPNASVAQVTGGSQIVPAGSLDFTNNLRLPNGGIGVMSALYWTYEPTNLMSTLAVNFAGTSYRCFLPQLQGQRLSLTFDGSGLAQLWQDDTLLAQNATSGSGSTNVVMAVTHPAGSWDTTNYNVFLPNPTNQYSQTVTNAYQSANATYALLYAFEPDWGWLQQRQQKLDGYLQAGYTNGTRQVTSETLNVMGLNWLLQTAATEQLVAAQLGILPQYFHRLGRMAEESGHGYYVDVYMSLSGSFPSGGLDPAHQQLNLFHFDLTSFFASAFEHGIIEQLQSTNLLGASTVKMLEIANTNGGTVYLAGSNNWSAIQGSLVNYGGALNGIHSNYVNRGYYVLLPANGSNHVTSIANNWAGYGFAARVAQMGQGSTAMIISGGYSGGYDSDPLATVAPIFTSASDDSQPNTYVAPPLSTPNITVGDPVDAADGTFQVEHTDLSVGQGEPKGISLSRYYNGTRRASNPAGMAAGWINNYYATANNYAAPQACLGGATPAQAAALITATAAAIATYNGGQPDAKNWLTTLLIAKWGVDQITRSGVSVNLGQNTLQFVQQPNGVFTPPANCTATLTQTNAAYSLALRHGNTYNFNTNGLLATIVDQYGNTLQVAYNSNNWVSTVTDWKSRVFNFSYTGGQLTSVSDGTRTVNYGYSSAGDLTTFTDAEGKTTTYAYDASHQITATIDPLGRTVITNFYDAQGHVATQYSQGDPAKVWRVFWSGWETVEQDPAGGQQTYFYDDQNRLVGQADALGNLSQVIYDGQNHVVMTLSPLNETNQFIYDGSQNVTNAIDALGFVTRYIFDNLNNLVGTVDALGHSNTFGYNAQFSLIGQTNGAGDTVVYAYNANGTLASRTDAGGATAYTYDAYGQLSGLTYPGTLGSENFINSTAGDVTSHTDGNDKITTFTYNNRRELTKTTGPTNLINSIAYDAVDNVGTNTDALSHVTTNYWSATRKLMATAFPATPQGTPIVTNIYDPRDWLAQTLDPLKNATSYTNDLAGRLLSVAAPVNLTNWSTYDNDGRELTSANAANETNSQTWDARGSPLRHTDGAGHFFTDVYDAAGNQIFLTNRSAKTWQFQVDAANRVICTTTPLLRSNLVVFNHQGLPTLLIGQAGQRTTNTFDGRGRLTSRGDKIGTTTNIYDGNNNLLSVTENGNTTAWTYDAYNRVSSYQDIYGNLIQYRYDANGNRTNLTYPGNRNVYYYFDSLNRLTNVTDWVSRKTSFNYDLDGHLTTITRPNGTFRTISYDAAGETTNIWEQMPNALPIDWFRLNWTNSGNMAWEFAAPLPHTNSPGVRLMTYDNDNRLASFEGPGMTAYQSTGSDLDGNLTNGPLITTNFSTYVYDPRNRLLNAGGVTNAYDAINNRVGQVVGTNTTIYVVNPNSPLPQVLMRIKNGVTNYYIYGAGLLYQITETAAGTNTLTYHYDYRGSTVAISGDNGLVTDRVEYSLYGSTTYRVGTNDTPFLFNGRYGVQTDPNGLLYLRSRYCNPYLCRFISPDPSGFKGGLNFYAYANGNPVSYIDPFGLNAQATGDSDSGEISFSSSMSDTGVYTSNNGDSAVQPVQSTSSIIVQVAVTVLPIVIAPEAAVAEELVDVGIMDATEGGTLTFYRGTTYYDALETVQNGAFDATRLAQNQASASYSPGLYLTSQETTANYYADLAGGGLSGRGGGPAVIQVTVPQSNFSLLAEKYNIQIETPVVRPPFPGQTETVIPPSAIDEFNAMMNVSHH